MKNLFLYVLILVLGPTLLNAQVVQPANPVSKINHSTHVHVDGICSTIQILETPESILAQQEFLRWHQAGRPGWERIQSDQITASIGDTRSFFTYNFDTNGYEQKEFELRAIGDLSVIWVERAELGENKVSDSKVQEMLASLENQTPDNSVNPARGIIANNRDIFGPAPNVDGSGKLSVLLTNIPVRENGLTTGGYFTAVNLSQSNPNSNRADIIYINTALIYNASRAVNLSGALSTLAHEDQHLIHASFGTLQTFLNEGQSELASVVNGYTARAASNLQTPAEVNQQLFAWRGNATEVLYDYARAGLFHAYIAERVGFEAAGTITRSGRNGVAAYERALLGTGLAFNELLLDFHTANLLNNPNIGNGNFAYTIPGYRSARTAGIAQEYASYMIEVSSNSNVQYGGAEVIQWTGVENFNINVSSPDQVRHRIVGRSLDGGAIEIFEFSAGSMTMPGAYESVTLLSVKSGITGATELNEPPSTYSYSSNWDPLPVERETIVYHSNSAFYAELPGDPTDDTRSQIGRYATRFSSTINGIMNQVNFSISGNAQALRGNGTLQVSLHQSVQNGTETGPNSQGTLPRFEPGTMIRSTSIDIRNLSRGTNVVLLDGQNWSVQKDTDYWLVFEVLNPSSDARVEFLIDNGSTDILNQNYFPTRGRVFLRQGSGSGAWARWASNNNYLVSAQITGLYEGELEEPTFTAAPVTQYTGVFGASFEVAVNATGTPAPVFIWTKDGQLFQSGSSPILRISELKDSDSGVYSVRAANYAGYTEPIEFILDVVAPEFRLAQNYPNPFNNSTTIDFGIAEDGVVTINVYDVMGRLITTLTQNRVLRRGFHQVSFNATPLASGVYIYTMRFEPTRPNGESYSNTRKMMLIK